MPQLQAPQFFVTPNSLADINKVRVSDMPQVWSWKQKAQQAEDIGLADLMRAQQEEQQLSPIRVKQAGANLESTITGTEGKKLENEGKRMDNKKTAATLDQAIITEAFKLRREAGEAEGKLFDLEVDKMLRSPDPNIQKQGRQLLDVTRKAIEEKRKADLEWSMKEKELRMQHSNAAGLQSARFAHEKDLRTMDTGKAIAVATIQAEARKAAKEAGGNPKKWQELAVALAVKLQAETDPDVKMEIAKELQFAQDMAERLAPQPQPTLDTSKLPPGTPLKDPRGAQPAPPSVNAPKPDPLGIR